MKDGKKKNVDAPTSSKKKLAKDESLPIKETSISLENDLEFPTSLNPELEELLEKDKKRFFGGCGG
ncbi:MAG TPA: hypothetical protein VLZ75_06470 [Chitinophagales bacterium]|nr:hypothetical protein [Chitinophagales bacterium]